MTNDKTVTMSRELAETVLSELSFANTGPKALKEELRALLADHAVPQPEWVVASQRSAPVVERQEPVAWQRKSKMEDGRWFEVNAEDVEQAVKLGYECRQLFASPPAPVAVVPTTDDFYCAFINSGLVGDEIASELSHIAWNLLDKVKELNQ